MPTQTEAAFDLLCITGGPFATNAYLIVDNATRKCAIVDPGYDADVEWGEIISRENLTLDSILLTHGHIDHTVGVADLVKAYPGVKVLIHERDAFMLRGGNQMAAKMFGLPDFIPAEPTSFLNEGDVVSVGETQFKVLFVPGHSPGHVAFLNGKLLISGDVIFMGSIGRTDLPGGDYKVLSESIVKKLLPLGDDVTIHNGHGPATTIGHERLSNPFVQDMLEGR